MSESAMNACCCIDVDEPPKFATDKIVKARKRHKCGECGDPIEPGQKYERAKLMEYDGFWSEYRTCLICVAIRRDFFPCGWYYTRLVEDFIECNGWDYRDVPDDEED